MFSTTAVVPFDEPEEGVMPDLVMIIQMDFFREAIREDLDNKLRRPTHGKRAAQDERSHRHRQFSIGLKHLVKNRIGQQSRSPSIQKASNNRDYN